MGGIFTSLFGKKLTPTSSKGRAWNTIKVHYRGLFGVIPPLIVLILLLDPAKPYKTVGGICFWMLWFLLLQPIPPNAVGIIPLFAFPFFGIMDTETTIKCYINETIIFFFLSGWLLMTLNCAGLDKRIVCFIFKIGGEKKFGAFPLLMKATMSSFLISMLSCRTSALPNMYDIIMPPLLKLQTSSSGEINYTKFNAILCNAITTSSIIGSMCIIHASVTTLQFKSLFVEIGDPSDFFNYLQFGAFAIPVGVAMLLWNTIYHFALIKLFVENKNKKMSQYSMKAISTAVTDSKKELGKMTFHRWIASVLLLLCFVVFLTRWSTWLGNGWSSADMFELDVKDATPAACFVLIFFVVPKTFNFLKIFTVKEEKDAPLKMESGVLFWKYVDKNLDYSYFIIFGGGLAVFKAVQVSGMPAALVDDVAAFTKFDWNLAIFIIVATSVFLANITSGVGAQAMLTPMFHALTATGSSPYPVKQHLIALGIGLASGFGMVSRFRDTPGYFTGTKGNVKLINQIRYGIGSTLICAIVLTLALCFYGPALWEVVIVVEKAPEATEAPGPQ